MAFTDSFQRYEIKYLLTEELYEKFRERTQGFLLPDEYGEYTVCSVYLDTDDYRLIRTSLEKPAYKEKLRLRSYGVPDTGTAVFLEIKKKFDGVVYKRRISLTEHEAEEYIKNGTPPESRGQIFNEIDYIMKLYRPSPKLYLAYDRIAMTCPDIPSLRVTFDRNIRSRRDSLKLSCGTSGELLRCRGQEKYRLMEIKTAASMPLSITSVLSELKIYPTSFSKYGEIYRSSICGKAFALSDSVK